MRRGARKVVIWSNSELVLLVLPKPFGFAWLRMFSASPRSSKLYFSRTGRLFTRAKSQLAKPGPRTTPRPALPGRTSPCGVGAKHDLLNHWPVLWGAPAFGSHSMSGRELAALFPSSPRPAGSTLEVVTVKGCPE